MNNNLFILSKYFIGFENKRNYLKNNINKNFFPYIDFDKNIITLNNIIIFYEQALNIIENYIKNKYPTYSDIDIFYNKIKYIIWKIGGFVSDNYTENINYDYNLTNCKILEYNDWPFIIYNVKPHMKNENLLINCGWYLSGTRNALEGAILKYKPKVVVEFGVYLAKSTVGIFQASNYNNINIDYYGFDRFTHIGTNRDGITFSPIDKLFINYPKLDTSISNVAEYSKNHNINFLPIDVNKALEYFKINNIIPDLLYIDCIKNPNELINMISLFLNYNKNIIIVGDDLSNRNKLKESILKFNPIIFNNEAYIIKIKNKYKKSEDYPKGISINTHPKLIFTENEIKKISAENKEYLNACL